MMNFLGFLMVGVFAGCWLLVVADHQIKGINKLIITVAIACIGGIVNSIYPIGILGIVAIIIGCVGVLYSVVKAKSKRW